MSARRKRIAVLDALVDAVTWPQALDLLLRWSLERESRYVCVCNVHSIVSGSRDPVFRDVLNRSDLCTPDGMPIAWSLRHLGSPGQPRIDGPRLMWRLCELAAAKGIAVFFYGSTDHALHALRARLREAFPALRIAGSESPPFRPLTPEEDRAAVARINASGAGIVFVGLGCPKQESWMAAHRGRVRGVMVGVGAAFDFHAGTLRRAPEWMQRAGLEWLHRLASEPRRLWKRYLVTNTVFVTRILAQLLRRWTGRPRAA